MKQLLGVGLLSWPRSERIAGRYGMVALWENLEEDRSLRWHIDVSTLRGTHGSLTAIIDGEAFNLGTGTFFAEQQDLNVYVGLCPDDARADNWLDARNLHKVDGFMVRKPVELYFEQEPA